MWCHMIVKLVNQVLLEAICLILLLNSGVHTLQLNPDKFQCYLQIHRYRMPFHPNCTMHVLNKILTSRMLGHYVFALHFEELKLATSQLIGMVRN